MSSKSKTKGSNGERELCKHLSTIFGGSFVRVPSSGAQVGGSNLHRLQKYSSVQGRAFRGDIIPPDNLPNLYIETKAYKNFRFHQLLQTSGNSILDGWIKQAFEGRLVSDVLFICFKINSLGWYVAVPDESCSGYLFENFCLYNKKMRITEMLQFFNANKDLIMQQAKGSVMEYYDEILKEHKKKHASS